MSIKIPKVKPGHAMRFLAKGSKAGRSAQQDPANHQSGSGAQSALNSGRSQPSEGTEAASSHSSGHFRVVIETHFENKDRNRTPGLIRIGGVRGLGDRNFVPLFPGDGAGIKEILSKNAANKDQTKRIAAATDVVANGPVTSVNDDADFRAFANNGKPGLTSQTVDHTLGALAAMSLSLAVDPEVVSGLQQDAKDRGGRGTTYFPVFESLPGTAFLMDLRVDNRSQLILAAAIDRDGQVTVFRLSPNGQTKGCRAEMRKILRKKAFALPTGYYKRVRIYVESSRPLARSSSMGTTWSRVRVTPYLRVCKSLRNDRRRVGAQFRLHLDQASRDVSFQKRVLPMVKRSPKTDAALAASAPVSHSPASPKGTGALARFPHPFSLMREPDSILLSYDHVDDPRPQWAKQESREIQAVELHYQANPGPTSGGRTAKTEEQANTEAAAIVPSEVVAAPTGVAPPSSSGEIDMAPAHGNASRVTEDGGPLSERQRGSRYTARIPPLFFRPSISREEMNAAFDAHFLSERKEAQAEARRIEAAKKDIASYSAQDRSTQRITPVKDGVDGAGQLSREGTSRAIERKNLSECQDKDSIKASPDARISSGMQSKKAGGAKVFGGPKRSSNRGNGGGVAGKGEAP